jgi:hypothetical protein
MVLVLLALKEFLTAQIVGTAVVLDVNLDSISTTPQVASPANQLFPTV